MNLRNWNRLLLTGALAAGCGDSSSNNDTAPDGSVSVDGNVGADAPAPDAVIPVVGTCGIRGIPRDSNIYYMNADDSALGTDTGITTAMSSRDDCGEGTTLVLEYQAGGTQPAGAPNTTTEIVVYQGVNPGTTIEFAGPTKLPPAPTSFMVVTGADPDPNDNLGVVSVEAQVPPNCRDATDADFETSASAEISSQCLGNTPGDIDVIGYAWNTAGGALRVAMAKDQPVTLDGDTEVTLGAWTDPVQYTLLATNTMVPLTPAISTFVDGLNHLYESNWRVFPDENNEILLFSGSTADGFADSIEAITTVERSDRRQLKMTRDVPPAGPTPAPITHDWSTAINPILGTALLTSDPDNIRVAWIIDGEIPGAVGIAMMQVQLPSASGRITVVFPKGNKTEIALPTIPALAPILAQAQFYLMNLVFFTGPGDYQDTLGRRWLPNGREPGGFPALENGEALDATSAPNIAR